MSHGGTRLRALVVVALALAACTRAGGTEVTLTGGSLPTITTVAPTTTAAPTTTTAAAAVAPRAATTSTTRAPRPQRPRVVVEQEWVAFAQTGGIVLRHPSRRVERIGFHESNHEGAQVLEPLPSAVVPTDLESRGRGTRGRTAADVVSDPNVEVRSPVSGKVLRAGRYVLYCKHSDDYVAIEPDDHPGWEVKILHIDGVQVRPGQRVEAGVTVIAPRPTQLPFESQVDEARTTDPAWPHVHVEVVDPSIPNVPSPGGGC